MSRANSSSQTIDSNEELAQIVVRVAEAAQVETIICATDSGRLAHRLHDLASEFRLIVTTPDAETYEVLSQAGLEALRLPARTADKYRQVRHIISVVLRSGQVSMGDLIVCATGHDLYPTESNLIVLTEVEPRLENLPVSELIKLTNGIRPRVLEATVAVACKIGRAARRGKHIGAIFMLGDSLEVLKGSKQLVPNPFQGHEETLRRLTNPTIHDALVELSKLDGAFVVRGDGFIQTAGTFLASERTEADLSTGLGARHAAAAAVTSRTTATAVVVSATDGNIRVFSDGTMVLQMDPEVAHSPITLDEMQWCEVICN